MKARSFNLPRQVRYNHAQEDWKEEKADNMRTVDRLGPVTQSRRQETHISTSKLVLIK